MGDTKNEKQLINEYCQREKVPNPAYTCTPDSETNTKGFFCTLTVNGQTFVTSNWEKSKKNAELQAAKLAVKKLNIVAVKKHVKDGVEANGDSKPKHVDSKPKHVDSKPKPVEGKGKSDQSDGKDPSWITIEKVEDIYKYLTDEVLAQEFKSFLHCKAQEEKKAYPVFTYNEIKDKGFTATVTYDGKQYNSLGLMMTKKQAEQSASEVCLRTLGDFPAVSADKYTIQIYKGGKANSPRKTKVEEVSK